MTHLEAKTMNKPMANLFQVGDLVVYPAHGTGRIMKIEERETAGITYQVYLVGFDTQKLTVAIPIHKAITNGLRSINDKSVLEKIIKTLKEKPKVKSGTWNRKAKEYEQKIKSGDLLALAEVVRDTYREAENRDSQSYSERLILEEAIERLIAEIAVIRRQDAVATLHWLNETCGRHYELESLWFSKKKVREETPNPFDPNRHVEKKKTPVVPSSMEQKVAERNFSDLRGGGKPIPPRQPSSPSKFVSPKIKKAPPAAKPHEFNRTPTKNSSSIRVKSLMSEEVQQTKNGPTGSPKLEKEIGAWRDLVVKITSERDRLFEVVAKLKSAVEEAELTARRRSVEIENLEKRITVLTAERDQAGKKAQANASAEMQRRAEKAEGLLVIAQKNAHEERARFLSTIADLKSLRDSLREELKAQASALAQKQIQLTQSGSSLQDESARVLRYTRTSLTKRTKTLERVKKELMATKRTLRKVSTQEKATAKKIREQINRVRDELLALIEERTDSLEVFSAQNNEYRSTIAKLRAQLRKAGHEPCS